MTYTFQGLIFSHEEIKKCEVHTIINVKNWRLFSESINKVIDTHTKTVLVFYNSINVDLGIYFVILHTLPPANQLISSSAKHVLQASLSIVERIWEQDKVNLVRVSAVSDYGSLDLLLSYSMKKLNPFRCLFFFFLIY